VNFGQRFRVQQVSSKCRSSQLPPVGLRLVGAALRETVRGVPIVGLPRRHQSVMSAQGISKSPLLRSWPVEELIDGSDKDCRNVISVHSAKLVSCCR
jgi:hypothetical protein